MLQFVVQLKTVSYLNFLLQFFTIWNAKFFVSESFILKEYFQERNAFLIAYIYDAVSYIEFKTGHVYIWYRNLFSIWLIDSYSTNMWKTSKVCRILYHVYHTTCLTSIYILPLCLSLSKYGLLSSREFYIFVFCTWRLR